MKRVAYSESVSEKKTRGWNLICATARRWTEVLLMADKCAMYVQTVDGFMERKEYDCFAAMKCDARRNRADRVLYWWCELEELEVRLHG